MAAWVLYAGAALLVTVAVLHQSNYFFTQMAVQNSALKMEYQQQFQALWYGFSAQAVVMALLMLLAGWRPAKVDRSVLLLCTLLMFVNAGLAAMILADAFSTGVLLVTAVLMLLGALLKPAGA
jgi:hypothetical protein